MMRRNMVVSALIGGLCGLGAGLIGVRWFAEPGRGAGQPGTLRGDVDALEARILDGAASELAARSAVFARLDALERAVAAGVSTADRDETRRGIEALAADVALLADASRENLSAADGRLAAIELRLRDLEVVAGATSPAVAGPLSDEEEGVWVTTARSDDPLRRFSALVKLSRARTDRSVRCAVDALRDPDERVVWQAVRNLYQFQERGSLRDIAALLEHPAAIVRQSAFEALVSMGAPKGAFDPAGSAPARKTEADRLRKWAAEQQ